MSISIPLQCKKCQQGQLAKGPQGWSCDHCGYSPFTEGVRERVPPPRPVVAPAPPVPEQVRLTDFPGRAATPPAPRGVLLADPNAIPRANRLFWNDAGSGVRYALEVPLQVVPPGQALEVRTVVHNQGPYLLSTEMLLRCARGDHSTRAYRVATGDLLVGAILDATYPLHVSSEPTRCELSLLCRACQPTGRLQDPWISPTLTPFTGLVPLNGSHACAVAEVRARSHCPRCESTMRFVSDPGPRPRAWVCEDCAHRVELGSLD